MQLLVCAAAQPGEAGDPAEAVDWEKQRRARLTRPKFIMVAIDEPVVSFSSDSSAEVRFLQHYQSDTIDSKGYKTLTLSKSGGRWLIVREVFEN